jgi:hypothetical protein
MSLFTQVPAVKKLDRLTLRSSMGNPIWNPQGKVIDVVGTIVEAKHL